MVSFAVLSRINLADASSRSGPNPRRFIRLQPLVRSCRSFSDSRPFFSITSALFDKNNRVVYPPRNLASCAESQKRLPVSPFPATLTHSLSRNPFACHSHANTRDMGATTAALIGRNGEEGRRDWRAMIGPVVSTALLPASNSAQVVTKKKRGRP